MEKIVIYNNEEIKLNELVDLTDPKIVYIYLINNTKCLVEKNQKIDKHTVIGIREDIDLKIYSSVSGKVIDICEKPYFNNKLVECVIIENDFKETSKDVLVENIDNYTKKEFLKLLQDCNVIGMGGSGFPSYIKYNNDINTLIINCCECEPYLSCDTNVFFIKHKQIFEAINAIMKINNIKDCYFAVEKNNYIVINRFKENKTIKLKEVGNYYSGGYERLLIKDILNVTYDKYPTEKNIVVSNVSTIFAIYKALKYQKSITKRIVTLVYDELNINLLIKVGITLKEIFERLNIDIKDNVVVLNGLMMGDYVNTLDIGINANISSVFIIKKEEYETTECMRCGKCNYHCSQGLFPVLIKDYKNNPEMLKKLDVNKCNECGICSYICPAKIDLKNMIKELKK